MNIFCRDQIPTQGTKGALVRGDSPEKWTEDGEGRSFAQICAKNEQCTEGGINGTHIF